jgi:tripartite-type tricarboxylate transporter receptor subunit TctC
MYECLWYPIAACQKRPSTRTRCGAGTPSPILERLNQEVNSVLKSNDVQERFASLGAIAVGGSAIEFERYLRNDLEKWARIVKQRHIKPD